MPARAMGDVIREGDWLHTGDILVHAYPEEPRKARVVRIESIKYHDDLTRSFILVPEQSKHGKLYRTLTSEKTLRDKYRRVHTNEERIQ